MSGQPFRRSVVGIYDSSGRPMYPAFIGIPTEDYETAKVMVEALQNLSMRCLQSYQYRDDPGFREDVNAARSVLAQATGEKA